MALPADVGYEGFEDPEDLYPGDTDTTLTHTYLGACQIRQVGVGGASTIGVPPNVLGALANPPAVMVTAANKVLTTNIYTNNDLGRYFPSDEYFAPTST